LNGVRDEFSGLGRADQSNIQDEIFQLAKKWTRQNLKALLPACVMPTVFSVTTHGLAHSALIKWNDRYKW
jgi:hypothetical protein